MSWYRDIELKVKGAKLEKTLEQLKPYIERAEDIAKTSNRIRRLDESESEYAKRQQRHLVPDYDLIRRVIHDSKLGIKKSAALERELDKLERKARPRVKIERLDSGEQVVEKKRTGRKPKIKLLD